MQSQGREGKQHQNEAERQQGGQFEAACGALWKFERDQRGYRVARGKERPADRIGVADHEGNGHGFTKGTAHTQHHATDHAGPRPGNDDPPHDLPARGTQPVGTLLEHGGHDSKHVTHDCRDKRRDHDRQYDTARQKAVAERCTVHEPANARHMAEMMTKEGLHMLRHEGHDNEETPHAENDGRHGSKKLHGCAHHTGHHRWRDIGQPEGGPEGQRHTDQNGDQRRTDRTENWRERTVFVGDRVPDIANDERRTEGAEGLAATECHGENEPAKRNKNQQGAGSDKQPKEAIALPEWNFTGFLYRCRLGPRSGSASHSVGTSWLRQEVNQVNKAPCASLSCSFPVTMRQQASPIR